MQQIFKINKLHHKCFPTNENSNDHHHGHVKPVGLKTNDVIYFRVAILKSFTFSIKDFLLRSPMSSPIKETRITEIGSNGR